MTKPPSPFLRIMRALGILLISLVMVFVLAIVFLQIPSVQQYAAGKATAYLEQQLQTTVALDRIQLRPLRSLRLQGVYIESPRQDTLLYAGTLDAGFSLKALWQKTVHIRKVSLRNASFAGTEENLTFLSDAFSSDMAQSPKPPPDNPWSILIQPGQINLRNVDVTFSQPDLTLRTHIGTLQAEIIAADITRLSFTLQQILLQDSQVYLQQRPASATRTDTGTTVTDPSSTTLSLSTRQLDLRQVDYTMEAPGMDLSATTGQTRANDITYTLEGSDMDFSVSEFTMAGAGFSYDRPLPRAPRGFDPNHMNLSNVGIQLRDLSYHNLKIATTLDQLSASDQSGAQINQLSGTIYYQLDSIDVRDMALRTPRSRMTLPNGVLTLPFLTGNQPLADMGINAVLTDAQIHPADLALFAPQLTDQSWFADNSDDPIALSARVTGSLNQLVIARATARGWDTRLVAAGSIDGLPNIDSTSFNLSLNPLETTAPGILRMLPASTLPAGVQLPQNAQLTGTVIGPINDLNLDIKLRTSRPEMPLATYLRSSLRLQNILRDSILAFEVQLDSLYTTRTDLLAWLPNGVLPTGTTLPRQALLTGTISGTRNQLDPDLSLFLESDSGRSEVGLRATVNQYQNVSMLSTDGQITLQKFSGSLLEDFLPQGSVPPSIRLPGIERSTLVFGGSLQQLELSSTTQTTVGTIKLTGNRRDSAYQIQLDIPSIDLNPVFPSAWTKVATSDTLTPLRIRGRVAGSGFDFSTNTRFTGNLTIAPASVYQWRDGLTIDLKGTPGQLIADLNVDEQEAKLNGQVAYRDTGSKPQVTANLNIEEINFSGLALSKQPFYLTTKLSASADGLSLTDMDGQVSIRETGIRYDSVYEELDSLILQAHLDSFENRIDLLADFMAAELAGSFDFQQINRKVRTHLLNHLRPEQLELRSAAASDQAQLNFDIRVFETNLLTSGIIPGLKGLKPMYAAGSFDEGRQTFTTQVRLPHLHYQSYRIDSFITQVESTRDDLNYLVDWYSLNLFQQFDVNQLTLQGRVVNGVLRNKLQQLDNENQERFRISTYLEQTDSSLIVTFDRNVLLNYNPWRLSPKNKIVLQENAVEVNDWDLTFGDQSLTITSSQAFRNDLTLNITKFKLSNIANLIQYDGELISGLLSGNIFLRDWQEAYYVETVLFADSLRALDAPLGNLNLRLRGGQNSDFKLSTILNGSENDLKINGTYQQTSNGQLDIQATVNALNLSALRPLARGNLSRLDGNGSGELTIKGTMARPQVSGALTLTDAYVQPSITRVTYHISEETINFDQRGIQFTDWQLLDPRGKEATLDGRLLTQNFQSFDFDLNLKGQNIQVLNTDRSHSNLYYGTLFTDATVQLTGPLLDPNIRAQAKNRVGSNITYLYGLSSGSSIDQGKDVVEFVNLSSTPLRADTRRTRQEPIAQGVSYDLQLNLQVTEDLDVTVVMDELTGDAFSGSGQGDLALRINSAGDIEMTGRLDLVEGTYNFTYSEVIKRTFEIGEGSYVQFSGDPYDPQLNLNTLYRTRASTLPLVALSGAELSPDEQRELTQRLPFVVTIEVGGSLKEIDLSTDITAQGSPGSMVTNALSQLRNDPSQLNTQAFSLILFNGFLAQGTATNSGLGDFDIQSGLNDFITSQLNNLANEYISFVELNFGIESDEASNGLFEDTNFRVSLRKNFLDDRLQISVDGVASTSENPDSGSQAFLDNLSVTYLLTEDGVLKIRIFNTREENSFTGGNIMRVGGALVFSKDFDRIKLFTKP